MKTIQMTLDEELINEVDKVIKKLGTTRSAFTRRALRNLLNHLHDLELEKRHKRGYKNKPIKANEFDIWDKEQVWID